jgi:hypothetical protein
METLKNVISIWHIFLGAVTAEQWYVVGSVVASILTLIGVVGWTKRHHLKKDVDKLEDWIITLLIWFYSFVLTIGGFVIAVLGFGINPAMFIHYFGTTWPYIVALAPGVYTFSKAAKKKLAERKAKKIHVTDQLIDGINDVRVPEPDVMAQPSFSMRKADEPITPISADIWAEK